VVHWKAIFLKQNACFILHWQLLLPFVVASYLDCSTLLSATSNSQHTLTTTLVMLVCTPHCLWHVWCCQHMHRTRGSPGREHRLNLCLYPPRDRQLNLTLVTMPAESHSHLLSRQLANSANPSRNGHTLGPAFPKALHIGAYLVYIRAPRVLTLVVSDEGIAVLVRSERSTKPFSVHKFAI